VEVGKERKRKKNSPNVGGVEAHHTAGIDLVERIGVPSASVFRRQKGTLTKVKTGGKGRGIEKYKGENNGRVWELVADIKKNCVPQSVYQSDQRWGERGKGTGSAEGKGIEK